VSAGARVLVVEDEEAIAEGVVFNLKRKGWSVELVGDGRVALERLAESTFDLIVLDVRLPEVDGFEVCQRLRRAGDTTPILMLTARNQPDDVIYGLKLGADDYVTKPFELAELLARAEGLLRRQEWARRGHVPAAAPPPPSPPPTARYAFGDFWVDFDTYEAKTRAGVVALPQKELEVMRLFASRPNQVVTRRELLDKVWGLPHHPNTRIVDNVIVELRQAFEESSTKPRHILSVRGVGYRFVP
jgi:DNA-binding response OmpR family regulator